MKSSTDNQTKMYGKKIWTNKQLPNEFMEIITIGNLFVIQVNGKGLISNIVKPYEHLAELLVNCGWK